MNRRAALSNHLRRVRFRLYKHRGSDQCRGNPPAKPIAGARDRSPQWVREASAVRCRSRQAIDSRREDGGRRALGHSRRKLMPPNLLQALGDSGHFGHLPWRMRSVYSSQKKSDSGIPRPGFRESAVRRAGCAPYHPSPCRIGGRRGRRRFGDEWARGCAASYTFAKC